MKKKTKYIVLFIALTLTPVVYFYHEIVMIIVFGTDHLFEPDPVKMHLVEGETISAQFQVRRGCNHDIGIQFFSENDDQIKNIFRKSSGVNLPANLDIKIINISNNEIEFNKISFGGALKASRRGSNPITLIAGRTYLKPGKYMVLINVNQIDKDLAMLETHFRAAHNVKNTCGSLN